jgi:hypothetical protein
MPSGKFPNLIPTNPDMAYLFGYALGITLVLSLARAVQREQQATRSLLVSQITTVHRHIDNHAPQPVSVPLVKPCGCQ